MLDLNDPVWQRLTTAYGQGEEAAEGLRRLETDASDRELRQELIELLLHQNTIYTATLAAIPYLANLAEKTEDDEMLLDLYISCGLMKLSREGTEGEPIEQSGEFRRARQEELDAGTVKRIADGYRGGMARLAALHDRASQRMAEAAHTPGRMEEDPEAVFLLAAWAAYAGNAEVARLLFDFSTGDEYAGACPSCEADWYVWPKDAGSETGKEPGEASGALIVYTDDPVLHGTDGRAPRDVRPAVRGTLRPELQSLESEARRLGAFRLARSIPSLDGRANCPECGQEQSVWTVLTGWRESS